MTNEHRYRLDKSSKKYHCPECRKKRFVRYIDTETGDNLPEQYGRCDREINCCYHLNPYNDGYAKMIWEQKKGTYFGNWKPSRQPIRTTPPPNTDPIFIPVEVVKQTLQGYEQNVFLQNLLNRVPFPFETIDIEKIISLYYLGTICNGYRAGAITFPFRDKYGNFCAIQVKQFDQENHTTDTDFLHSIIEKHHPHRNFRIELWISTEIKAPVIAPLFTSLLKKYH